MGQGNINSEIKRKKPSQKKIYHVSFVFVLTVSIKKDYGGKKNIEIVLTNKIDYDD